MAEQKNKPKPAGEALSCGLIFILRRRMEKRVGGQEDGPQIG